MEQKIKRLYNDVLIRNYEEFEPVPRFYDEKSLNYNGFLIVVLLNNSESRQSVAHSMLYDLWKQRVVNVFVLIFGSSVDEIEVYTGFPYQIGNCDKIVVRKLPLARGRHYQNMNIDKKT